MMAWLTCGVCAGRGISLVLGTVLSTGSAAPRSGHAQVLLDEQILPVVQEALVPVEGRAVDLDPVVAPATSLLVAGNSFTSLAIRYLAVGIS
jgi:hypothetical protein